MMVLASIAMAQNPANTQSFDYTPKNDHELLIQIVGELKGLHVEIAGNQKEIAGLRNEMNVRFDAMDKRFDDNRFFLFIIAGLFTSLVGIVIGFAFWDRRSMLKPLEARVEPIEKVMAKIKIEQESASALDVLREMAKSNLPLIEIMKNKHLL